MKLIKADKNLIIGSVVGSRAIYALNWYTISPLFTMIAIEFGIKYGQLGIIPTVFMIGAGLFQIPAGILSSRYGAKNIAMLGMLILSVFTILSGLSWNLESMLIFRFFIGVGAALYFAPAIGLLNLIFSSRSQGLAMGIYNSAFNIGAGIGLVGWVFVADLMGWRWALILGGIIGLIITFENITVLPANRSQYYVFKDIKKVLFNKNIWYLGLGLAGFWGGYFTAAQLLYTYLKTDIQINSTVAGIAASLILFAGVAGGPLFGKISDVYRKRKVFIYISTIIISVLYATMFTVNIYTVWFYVILIGLFTVTNFSMVYTIPAEYKEISNSYLPLALGTINSIQIMIGAIAPYLFTYIGSFNKDLSWIFLGIFTLMFLPFIYFAKGD